MEGRDPCGLIEVGVCSLVMCPQPTSFDRKYHAVGRVERKCRRAETAKDFVLVQQSMLRCENNKGAENEVHMFPSKK